MRDIETDELSRRIAANKVYSVGAAPGGRVLRFLISLMDCGLQKCFVQYSTGERYCCLFKSYF